MEGHSGQDRWIALGAVAGALGGSLCCVLPVAVALLGVGSAAVGAAFEPFRPTFIALTLVLLGAGFYQAYKPRPQECAPGESCVVPASRRRSRRLLWTVAFTALLLLTFPYSIGWITAPAAAAAAEPSTVTSTFRVTGMTCGGCEAAVERAVKKLDGVEKGTAAYQDQRAVVTYDSSRVTPAAIIAAIEKLGYRAELETDDGSER